MSAHHPPPPPPPPPRVIAGELRPGRVWYAVGAGIIVLGAVTGAVVFFVMLFRAVGMPDFAAELRGSGEAVFSVGREPGQVGLYSSPADADPSACSLVSPEGEERAFGPPSYTHSVQVGNESWSLIGTHPHPVGGEYTLVCDGEPNTVYAVAEVRDGPGFLTDVMNAMASFLGIPLVGLLVGIPILIVTGVRRGRHKRRLLNERARYPYRP